MADSEYATEMQKKLFMKRCAQDAAYFAENVVNDEFGDPYILEAYQKQYLRCPALKKLLFWGRRLSKSLMIKIEIMHKSVFNRAHRGLVVSPTMEQAIYFGEDIQDLLSATPMLDDMFVSKKSTKFKLKNNSRIYMATAGRGGASQLGKNALYLAFDETQIIPEETFTSLRPTLRGQKRAKTLVYAGTPMAKLNEFYRAYSNGKFYLTHEGAFAGEGGPRDFVVFERPTAFLNEKGLPVGASTDRITLDELLDDYRDMPLTGFLREYCLQWMDSIGEVFSQELINKIVNWDEMPQDVSEKKLVMGLDVGKKRNCSVLTIGELTGNGVKVINVIEWDLNTKYHEIIEDIMDLRTDYPNTVSLVMDETGVGKGVIEIMEKRAADRWRSLDVIGFDFAGPKKKIDLVEGAITELESGKSTIVYNPRLVNEMLEFKREITPQGNIKYQKPVGGSDDFVDSLLLCLYAGRDYYGYLEEDENLESVGFSILSQRANKFARVRI